MHRKSGKFSGERAGDGAKGQNQQIACHFEIATNWSKRERVIVKRAVNGNSSNAIKYDLDGVSVFEKLDPGPKYVIDFVVEYDPPKIPGVTNANVLGMSSIEVCRA